MSNHDTLINQNNPKLQHLRKIIQQMKDSNTRYFANDNIHEFVKQSDLMIMQECLEEVFSAMLEILLLDAKNDYNLADTNKRLAKMYVNEILAGRYHSAPDITLFPNEKKLEELCVIGPMKVRTLCSHHFVPVIGNVNVGILYGEQVLGLSKFQRIIDWIIARPHIQEEAAVIIADELERLLKPKGLCVSITAKHYCMLWRGVKAEESSFTNIVKRGILDQDRDFFHEFMRIVSHHH